MYLSHKLARHPVAADLHQCHMIRNEFVHFLHNLLYYLQFEVISIAWIEFSRDLDHALELDHILKAHTKYLKLYIWKSLLHYDKSIELLYKLLDLNLKFHNTQEIIYGALAEEIEGSVEESNENLGLAPLTKSELSTILLEYQQINQQLKLQLSEKQFDFLK